MGNIHEGHRARLIRTFLNNGLSGLEPHNALEIILTYSIPRRDVNEIAHRLLKQFGGGDKVLEADFEQLIRVDGVGRHTAAHLKLLLECFRYYEQQKSREAFFAVSAKASINYAKSLFVGETQECCFLLCFDVSMKLIKCSKISEGSLTGTALSVRRVVEIASACRAVSAIIAHNHPSGLAVPTTEDLHATQKVIHALTLIDVDLADHIIVGSTGVLSMAENGVLQNLKQAE